MNANVAETSLSSMKRMTSGITLLRVTFQGVPGVVDPGNSRLSRQSSGGKNVSDVVARGGRAVVAVDGYRQLHMMSRCTTDEPDAMDSARGS